MKRFVISVLFLSISFNVFASSKIETFENKLLKHSLVQSYDFDASSDNQWAFRLKLKNGHEIYFKDIKSDLTFNKWSGIRYINDIRFSTLEHKPNNRNGYYSFLSIKYLCIATGTKYNDVFSILDNYNEFCKLLNSIPWVKDDNAEKFGIEYSDDYYVYLFRCPLDNKNSFIEISDE